jgi:hypothetical protein
LLYKSGILIVSEYVNTNETLFVGTDLRLTAV